MIRMTQIIRAFDQLSHAAATAPLIHWLDDAGASDASSALGGKARPLVALLAAGLPVPPGFVIAPEAFPAHPPAAGDGSEGAGGSAPDTTGNALSPAAVERIREAYAELGQRCGEAAPSVAVRSSAAAEDLTGASFAGQYETFLGVRGAEAVLDYAARCWASLFTPHALAYRRQVEQRTARPLPPPAMSVLVQSLVVAEAAGVAFTADPISGELSALTINAAWGLGQSVVDGEVEADTWKIDRASRTILQQTTGDKATRSGVGPQAARQPVPDALRQRPCLTPEEAIHVADLALRAEAVIGAPADVEWAIGGIGGTADIGRRAEGTGAGQLWLLQARPITTGGAAGSGSAGAAAAAVPASDVSPALDAPATPAVPAPAGPSAQFPFAWPDDATARLHWKVFSRGQAIEPVKPLEQDGALAAARAFWNAALLDGSERAQTRLFLNGYAYAAFAPLPGSEHDRTYRHEAFRRTTAAFADRGISFRSAVHFPEIDAANERLGAVDVFAIPPDALASHLEECLRWFERAWTLHWFRPQGIAPAQRFRALHAEITGDDREGASAELLAYEPNLLIEAIDGLFALARIVQQHAALRALFETTESKDVLDALDGVEGGAAFRTSLDDLLRRQGLRCGGGFGTAHPAFMLPGWREDPSVVIELVQKYVPQDLDALLAARHAARAARDRRVDEIRRSITDEDQRREFDFWLDAARQAQQAFEDHNYKIDSAAAALLHYAITGAARRLAAAGVVETAEDIWWLHAHEIALTLRGLAAAPAAGAVLPADLRLLIAARKTEDAWRRTLTPPAWLGAPPAPDEPDPTAPGAHAGRAGAQPAAPTPAPAAETPAPPATVLVTGQTGCAGTATGRVRLADRNALVPDVEPGDVLVAHNAGPLWTPVFPTVVAVVLNEGTLTQHAMLTCREYGVPAIFQTKQGTTLLKEGQRVTVDATHGWVLPAE
jgi:pyruvate,water dikinase